MALRNLLLDTNAYSAFKSGRPEALEIISHASVLGLDSIVLGELLGGFVNGAREAWNRRQLEEFCSSSRVRRFPVDDRTAEYYANIYSALKRKGRPIPTNDMWIAASALRHELALFSFDGHFRYIDGLVVGSKLENFIL